MDSSTRIPRCEVVGLCGTIHASGRLPAFGVRVLGLFLCVRLTLTYLRHNLPQELLAELYGVSQAPVSRVISTYTPLIAACLNGNVPTVENLDPTAQLIIDGTLLQCWHWAGHPELYSDKHQTTGLNVQVSCTLSRTLARNLHPKTDASTTPRPCAAADCSTYWPPTYPTGHHHSTSATRGTSDWV